MPMARQVRAAAFSLELSYDINAIEDKGLIAHG